MSTLTVLYQSSDYYSPITGTSIISLLKNNSRFENIDIYLINDEIKEENQNKIKNIVRYFGRTLVIIDGHRIKKKILELKISPFRGSYTTYLKLFFLDEISAGRILTIDSDTLIVGCLEELFVLDMNDFTVAATLDCTHNDYKKLLRFKPNDYFFNGGILLIDLIEWKKKEYIKKITNYLLTSNTYYQTADQDILNIVLKGDILKFDPRYNYNSGFDIYGIKNSLKLYKLNDNNFFEEIVIQEAKKSVIIYHCMGLVTGRPWEHGNIHPQKELYIEYLNQTPFKNVVFKSKKSILVSLQKILFLYMPRRIYISIHSTFLKKYHRYKHSEINNVKKN